jgi:hypothetical protein
MLVVVVVVVVVGCKLTTVMMVIINPIAHRIVKAKQPKNNLGHIVGLNE